MNTIIRVFIRSLIELIYSLNEDKKQYFLKDPSLHSVWGLLVHVGFHSLVLYRLSRFFYKLKLYPIAFVLYYLTRVLYSVDIHPGAKIAPGVVIDHGTGVVIGPTASVGKGTVIYHNVTLGAKYITSGKRHPDVGENVIIGAGAKILGPVKIGDNSKIGANAVVLVNVPENSTAVGIPAKVVRKSPKVSKLNIPDTAIHLDCNDSC